MAKELSEIMLASLLAESDRRVFCQTALQVPALSTAPAQLLLVLLRPVKHCKALRIFLLVVKEMLNCTEYFALILFYSSSSKNNDGWIACIFMTSGQIFRFCSTTCIYIYNQQFQCVGFPIPEGDTSLCQIAHCDVRLGKCDHYRE